MKNEIILYQSEKLTAKVEVRVEDETVWLNRQQISTLFDRDVKTIGKHINNVFSEGELVKELVVANFATTTQCTVIRTNYEKYSFVFTEQCAKNTHCKI